MDAFSFAAIAVSSVFSLIALFFAVHTARRASALLDHVRLLSALPPESLSARLNELEETVSLLANRVKMMRVRNAVTHTDKSNGAAPDPYKDPNGWRAEMNRKLAFGKLKVD